MLRVVALGCSGAENGLAARVADMAAAEGPGRPEKHQDPGRYVAAHWALRGDVRLCGRATSDACCYSPARLSVSCSRSSLCHSFPSFTHPPLFAMAASWNMAGTGRHDFLKERIPSSQHFDIDEVADPSSPYPHMLPSEQGFEEHAGRVCCCPGGYGVC